MKHRHLRHEDATIAAIKDILAARQMPARVPPIAAIQADPCGEVATTAPVLCERSLRRFSVFPRVPCSGSLHQVARCRLTVVLLP